MDHPRRVNIEGIGDVYAAPMLFAGEYDGRAFTDMVAFCVDIYHRITRADYAPDLTYTDANPFLSDSNPTAPTLLTSAQIGQVGRLANYGTLAFYNAPATSAAQRNARWDELAAVQGAIWQVVSGRNVTSANLMLDGRIDALSGAGYASLFDASYGHVGSSIVFLTPLTYPDRRGTQGMVTVPVPEPGAWVLMIGGFGMAGAAIRGRRRKLAA